MARIHVYSAYDSTIAIHVTVDLVTTTEAPAIPVIGTEALNDGRRSLESTILPAFIQNGGNNNNFIHIR